MQIEYSAHYLCVKKFYASNVRSKTWSMEKSAFKVLKYLKLIFSGTLFFHPHQCVIEPVHQFRAKLLSSRTRLGGERNIAWAACGEPMYIAPTLPRRNGGGGMPLRHHVDAHMHEHAFDDEH